MIGPLTKPQAEARDTFDRALVEAQANGTCFLCGRSGAREFWRGVNTDGLPYCRGCALEVHASIGVA